MLPEVRWVPGRTRSMFAPSCEPSSSNARFRIWTLRIWGVRGSGSRSARQVLFRNASRLVLDHFSKHLSSVLGRDRALSRGLQSRAPKPQIIRKPPFGTVRNFGEFCRPAESRDSLRPQDVRGPCDPQFKRGKKNTPKMFSALRNQGPQQAKQEVRCIPKLFFLNGRKERHIYTKEPSRCLRATSSHTVLV